MQNAKKYDQKSAKTLLEAPQEWMLCALLYLSKDCILRGVSVQIFLYSVKIFSFLCSVCWYFCANCQKMCTFAKRFNAYSENILNANVFALDERWQDGAIETIRFYLNRVALKSGTACNVKYKVQKVISNL